MKAKLSRVSKKFADAIEKASIERIVKKVDKKLRSSTEMTEMITNCPSWISVDKELKTLPRRKDER